MPKKFDILVLTDHSVHTGSNSLYGILNSMQKQETCGILDVASRGFAENDPFFNGINSTEIYVSTVADTFAFSDKHAAFQNRQRKDPAGYDYVLLRLPHPVSDSFFSFLQTSFDEKRIINRPSGIQKSSSKEYLLKFAEFCPPMKLCKTVDDIIEFGQNFPIVLKPLRSYGGKGVVKLHDGLISGSEQSWTLEEYLPEINAELEKGGMLAMEFLKNVTRGDKRTVVVYGKIIGSSLRMPPKGSWLCNVAQGGKAVAATANQDEKNILNAVIPDLLKMGVVMVGMDTLVGNSGKRVLSELNTLSIGGVAQMHDQSRKPLLEKTASLLLKYMKDLYTL